LTKQGPIIKRKGPGGKGKEFHYWKRTRKSPAIMTGLGGNFPDWAEKKFKKWDNGGHSRIQTLIRRPD